MKTTTASALTDIAQEADVKTLVDSFYDKVNRDQLLGPAFNAMARVYWPQHLFTMYDFWSSVLFDTMHYQGRPFPRHLGLPTEGPHFYRWLQLFEDTVEENFAGPKAEEAKAKARNLVSLFDGTPQTFTVLA